MQPPPARSMRPRPMRTFTLVWMGQVVSLLGSGMTQFALVIYVWEEAGRAMPVVLVGFFAAVAGIIASPIAGSVVDRYSRKRVIIAADLCAALITLGLLALLLADQLALWHLYAASAVASFAGTFHLLAFSAAITTMIPQSQYGRASAMQTLAQYAAGIGAPLLGGVLVTLIGVGAVLVIDMLTFLFAVTVLSAVPIPSPPPSEDDDPTQAGFWRGFRFGLSYITSRSGLFGLLLMYLAFNSLESLGYPLLAPMILARTGGDEVILGTVQSVMGIGGVIGAVAVSIWGGPRRRIHALLISMMLTGLLGDVVMGVGRGLIFWAIAAFCVEAFIPLGISSSQAIWQSKVAPAVQGRVFAVRSAVSGLMEPISLLLAGFLADSVFEPALMPDGALADTFGWLVGTGPGAGMGLLFVICGILAALVGVAGYAARSVREVETTLPDVLPAPDA